MLQNCHLRYLIAVKLYIDPRRLNINHAIFGEKFRKVSEARPQGRAGLGARPVAIAKTNPGEGQFSCQKNQNPSCARVLTTLRITAGAGRGGVLK